MTFRPGNRTFRAVATALNFPGREAITEIEEKARPIFDVQASVEAGVVRQVVLGRQITAGAGAATANIALDPHTAAHWSLAFVNGVASVDVAAGIPREQDDVWVTGLGITVDAIANVTSVVMEAQQASVLTPIFSELFYFGDTEAGTSGVLARGVLFADPILKPLPWWFPPRRVSTVGLGAEIITTNANDTMVMLTLLTAPEGVLRRFYG